MIGIAATAFDTQGAVLAREVTSSTDYGTVSRRVSRRATLDGGAAFEDRGAFNADRTFQIDLVPTRELRETLQRLVETYRWLLISIPEGVFRVAPREAELSGERIRLTLLVESKRSA